LEICFIPTNTAKSHYICLLCKHEQPIEKGYSGFCNHVTYKHIKSGETTIEEYFNKQLNFFPKEYGSSFRSPSCKECSKPTKFKSIAAGYVRFCSFKCSQKNSDTKKLKYERTKESLILKYGVENASQIKDVPEKVKNTKKLRYGDENYVNRAKAIETNLIRHGVENYTQTDEYKKQTRQTSFSKYGVEHFTQAKEIKEKAIKTNLIKYGVSYPMQSEDVKRKVKETVANNGGWALLLPENREKSKQKIKQKVIDRIKKYNITFENVELLSLDNKTFKCKICNHSFVMNSFGTAKSKPRSYPRCHTCFPIGKQNKCSLFHQEFLAFLVEELKINLDSIKQNDTTILCNINKEIDFYLQDYNIAIELNGNIWHTEIFGGKDKRYHLQKTIECEKKQIQLLHIFEDEWDAKKDLIKQKVSHILGLRNQTTSVYARKCTIKEISPKNCNDFLEKNHFQGAETNSKIRFGAFFKEELIAVMTFGKPRLNLSGKNEEGTYELIRFATDYSIKGVGIASKLFNYFIKIYMPFKVYSYADRRWTSTIKENVYIKSGFDLTSYSEPNYFYVNPKTSFKLRENRFKYRKTEIKKLFSNYDENLTEWENMRLNKYDRIWDCGTIKYTWLRTK